MKRTLFVLIALSAVVAIQAQVGVGYYRSGYGSVQKAQDVGPLTRNHNINTWCGYKELEQETSQRNVTPLELRLQSSSNGLGLALSF